MQRRILFRCCTTAIIAIFCCRAAPPKPATVPATQPAPELFAAADAPCVIYLLPHDGSMLSSFDALCQSVSASIARLKPTQRFNITFIEGNAGVAMAKAPLAASPKNQHDANEFLHRASDSLASNSANSGDEIAALRLAFAQHPQRIFFLANGDVSNNRSFTKEVHNLNAALQPAERVQIHTIAWMNHDKEFEKWMKDLAGQNEGSYRYIDPTRTTP